MKISLRALFNDDVMDLERVLVSNRVKTIEKQRICSKSTRQN